MPFSGAATAYIGAGGLILYSGIKGSTISDTVRSFLSGTVTVTDTEALTDSVTAPADASTGNSGSGETGSEDTSAVGTSAASNQALARKLAVQLGHPTWVTGQEWDDWVKLWDRESGWSITAANPTSDARGIAQDINGYGPEYQAGNAESQITWGINYIAGRYGSPSLAWAHETQIGWY